jgi:hypothetical protein
MDEQGSPRKSGKFWRQQVAKALEVRKTHEPWWDSNLRDYAPSPTQDPEGYTAQINSNRDFTLVERKKADLFFQKPEVTLQPTPLMEGPIVDPTTQQPLLGPPDQTGQQQPVLASVALQVHQELVNEKLGADGIDATRLAHQAIFDMLALSGVGWTKLGYEQVARPVETLDPMTGLPRTVDVPVKSHCYWEYFSPKQSLVPHGFRRTEWDKAPWLGHQFELPLTESNRRKYRLPADFKGSKTDQQQHFDHGAGSVEASDAVFTGVELWYRSVLFRDDVFDPDHLTHLVLVDGVDEDDAIALEEDCPEQTLDETGKLTADSLVGFPIHPLNARTLTDSAYPPADCTVTRPLVRELNISREQNVQFRDAMSLRWIANSDVLPKEALAKIVRAPIGGIVSVPGDAFMGEGAIKELPQGSMPRENFSIQEVIDNDIARSWALDAGQQGVQSASSQTATAEQIQQANANARLDWERGIVLSWYVKGVTKLSTYLLRYLPVEQAAAIVGPQRAQLWDAWRKTGVNSALAFTAMPDSALRVDQAVDRKASQELYSFLANDPFVNRGELLKKLLRKFHLDPATIVVQPPPPKPEPPKLALSFKGEDLIGPQAPIVLEILAAQGIQVSPEAVSLSQGMLLQAQQMAAAEAAEQEAQDGDTKHGGKVAQQESLSKHASDKTGGMQNTGAPAAMGNPGGFLQ